MRILPCQQNIYKSDSCPSFGVWNRTVYKKDPKTLAETIVYRNDTFFVRHLEEQRNSTNVESWIKFVKFIEEKYEKSPSINFYNYACSDGSETYTFLMALMSRCRQDFQSKFKKLYAIDIDKDAIKKAKCMEYDLTQEEYNHILKLTQNKMHNYMDIRYNEKTKGYLAKPKDILKSKVEFIQADVLEDFNRIKPTHSVVFARNFWPYLEEKMPILLKKLGKQLKENSVLAIGLYDKKVCPFFNYDITNEIIKKGFRQTEIENIFEK